MTTQKVRPDVASGSEPGAWAVTVELVKTGTPTLMGCRPLVTVENVSSKYGSAKDPVIVDVEIYKAAAPHDKNPPWDQCYYEQQVIPKGKSKLFIGPLPSVDETYRVEVGVFKPGWAEELYFEDSARDFDSPGGCSWS